MIAAVLSLPVSIGLLIWIGKMKKDDPFPKGTFIKLLIAGALSGIISSIITISGMMITLLIEIGPDGISQLTSEEGLLQFAQQLSQRQSELTFGRALIAFIRIFITVGFAEEIIKFLCAKSVIKKKGVARTWMDALLCFCVVAIGFQLIEDIGYSSGNVATAIFRALTPFHFTFAAIMGYYYGLGKTKKNKICNFLAIFVPSIIHTIFDYCGMMSRYADAFVLAMLAMSILLFILTIVMILKIRKWHKEKTLDIVIED